VHLIGSSVDSVIISTYVTCLNISTKHLEAYCTTALVDLDHRITEWMFILKHLGILKFF